MGSVIKSDILSIMYSCLHVSHRYWASVTVTAVSSGAIVFWFDYPAQLLFWFFAVDIYIVSLFVFVQLLRFSAFNNFLLWFWGLAILGALAPFLLNAFVVLLQPEIMTWQDLSMTSGVLAIPIGASILAYFYITQSDQFTRRYVNRHKFRFITHLVIGVPFFTYWITYVPALFGSAFEINYVTGFVVYLLYKLIFDGFIYYFFARYKPKTEPFVLND